MNIRFSDQEGVRKIQGPKLVKGHPLIDCINLMSMQTVPGERAATFNTKRKCKRLARMQDKGDN